MNNDAEAPSSLPRPRLPWLAERLQQRSDAIAMRNNGPGSQQGGEKHVRRIGFLDDLIRQIDLVIGSHMVLLCYLECSLGRLFLRLLPQTIFASDPQLGFLVANITTRPYLICIILTNMICVFLHLAWDPPSGTELSRGYIHGGLLIDFVGEPAPASRWRMLFLDMCIFFLQLLQMAAVLEQREIKLSRGDPLLLSVLNRLTGRTGTQDLDAEEQGIRRSQELAQDGEEGDEDDVRDPLASEKRLIDESYDGRMLIMTFNPVRLVNKAWHWHLNASSQESRTRRRQEAAA